MFPERLATGLAARLAPRRVRLARNLAGALAALGLVLLFDPFTSWARQFAGGLSEPLLVALVLGAIDRELSRARGQALALALAAALLRPEAWPLLVVYGYWLWRDEPRLRRWLVAGAVAVPVLWLVPDLIGSGDPLTGAQRARGATGSPVPEALEALGRSLEMPHGGALGRERGGRGERPASIASERSWCSPPAQPPGSSWSPRSPPRGTPGLPRFAAPAAAIVCVLGGVGMVRLLAEIDGMRLADPRRRRGIALAGLLAVALSAQALLRLADIPGELDRASDYGREIDRLGGLVEETGADRLTRCGPVTTTDFLTVTPLAWELDLPLAAIGVRVESAPSSGVAIVRAGEPRPAAAAIEASGRLLGEHGGWAAYEVSCPPAASAASGRAIAGVAGAERYGGSSSSSSSR